MPPVLGRYSAPRYLERGSHLGYRPRPSSSPASSIRSRPKFTARRTVLGSVSFPAGYGAALSLLLDAAWLAGVGALAHARLGPRPETKVLLPDLVNAAHAILVAVITRGHTRSSTSTPQERSLCLSTAALSHGVSPSKNGHRSTHSSPRSLLLSVRLQVPQAQSGLEQNLYRTVLLFLEDFVTVRRLVE
jgi:hypothetical protein